MVGHTVNDNVNIANIAISNFFIVYDFNVLPNLATFTFNNKSFANLPVQSLHIPQRGNTDLAIIVYLGYRSISRLCCTSGGKNIIYDQDVLAG